MGKKHHVGRTAWVFALVVVVSLCGSFVCVCVFCSEPPGVRGNKDRRSGAGSLSFSPQRYREQGSWGLRPGLAEKGKGQERAMPKVSASSFPTGEDLLITPSVAIEMPYFYISL